MAEIVIPDAVKAAFEKGGLKVDDIKKLINGAEASKDKIVSGARCIAKKVMGDVTVYADYNAAGDKLTVNSVYSHKMKILDIVMDTADSDWIYAKNGAKVRKGHTNLSFVGATRSAPSLVEPTSGESWLEEYLAAKTIAVAEMLFSQKRA
jgi:transposase-like protein